MTGSRQASFSPVGVTVLDRFLTVQLIQIILFGILLFTIVWLAPETLFKLIQAVFAEKLTLKQAALMFLLYLPPILQQSIPMAVLFGAIFLFRRLSLQSELVALLASGIHPYRLLLPVVLSGVLFCMLHFGVQELITPKTSPILDQLSYASGLKNRKDDNFVFVEKNRAGQLEKFFLIGQIRSAPLTDFLILYYTPDALGNVQITRILKARHGAWNSQEKAWQLREGMDYALDESGVYREIHQFDEQWVTTSKYPAKLLSYSTVNPINMDMRTLSEYMQLLNDGGQYQDVQFCEVRWFQKWTLPLASILFALLGALLGVEHARSQRNFGLTAGALVIFLYSVLTPFTTNLGSLGLVPSWLAAILPLSLIAAITGAIFIRGKQGFLT